MGVVNSKSPLERRNTVLRRSQRKSIHGVKLKTDKLAKDIQKFKGVEEDAAFAELKARIESVERDLKVQCKNIQPQIRSTYNDALARTQECYKLLDEKVAENAKKAQPKPPEEEEEDNSLNDDVFIESIHNEEQQLEESTNKRRTVELKLIQVQPIEGSPRLSKRLSLLKMGVPVMPGSMMEELQRKAQGHEGRIADIRRKIEDLELEVSKFVGKKGGKYYDKIKTELEGYSAELNHMQTSDEAIQEQIKMCSNYIVSCMSFLDEKAVVEASNDGTNIDGDVADDAVNNNFSPGTMRTTYI